MTFEQFCRILIKRWSFVVICFLFVGLGAYIGSSKLIKPLYQSTTLVEAIVNIIGSSQSSPLSNDNILASQQVAGTEVELVTTYPVLSEVASHYPGLSVDSLTKEVTATARPNTPLFEIDVLDPSPTRAANLANTIAATLIRQQLQVAQQNGAQGNFLVVVQSARPPSSPAQPNKLLYTAAGLLVGLLLGVLLAVLFDFLDTHVSTKEALTELLEWPILGTLWQSAPEDIINPVGYKSNMESYGTLRTNIGFAAIDKPLQTLVVTSGTPDEGKSVVAANLAIFMAKAGKNTLLIDANLRRPTQHEQFSIPAHAMGFSNVLLAFSMPTATNALFTPTTDIKSSNASVVTSKVALDPFVRPVDIPNLYIMPSGPLPPNPPELLDSKAIQGLLAALNNCGAEVVIFDAPPLLGLSDASILASKVDGTLVVVDITRANRGKLKQVKALLEQARVRVLGCVVNKERQSRKDSPSSYGYMAEKWSKRDSHSRKDPSYPAVSLVVPTISRQAETPSRPERNEPTISRQAETPSRPERNEPMISRQAETPSRPERNEPTISKQAETPSRPERNGQNNGEKHGKNNGDSPVATFDDRDQTIILPLVNASNTNNRRKTGDLREDD